MNRRNLIIGIAVILVLCCLGAALVSLGNQDSSGKSEQAAGSDEVAQQEDVTDTPIAPDPPNEAQVPDTPEPVATDTPDPTDTSEPTKTLEPTETPEPTDTPEPTNTPKPTNTPEPAIEVVEGLGVSRDDIFAVYTQPEIGFTFEESSQVDGQPRIFGHAPNELALLELIGPTDNLTQTTIAVGVPSNNATALAENVIYMLGLLNIVLPDWDEGPDWVNANFETVAIEGTTSTNYDNKTVSLTFVEVSGLLFLNIEAE